MQRCNGPGWHGPRVVYYTSCNFEMLRFEAFPSMGFLMLGSMETGFGRQTDWAQCGCEGGESTSDTARLDELKTRFPRFSKNLLYIIILIIILSIEKGKE